MAPDADATAGASQGWHDLEAVLAEEPAATLLAAYLGRPEPGGATPPVRPAPRPSGWRSRSARRPAPHARAPSRSRGRATDTAGADRPDAAAAIPLRRLARRCRSA